MFLAIKIFHFIGLALLLGGGISNGVLLGKAGTGDDTAKSALRSASRRLGQITFIGLVILWGTGIYMISNGHGGAAGISILFWAKIAVVVLLSISALAAQFYSIMAMFRGSRTPREKVIRLTAITTLLTLVALVLAVWTFSGGHEEPTADMPAVTPAPEPAPTADTPAEMPVDIPAELPAEPAAEPPSS